jgi:hypothetical protein
MQHDGQPVDWTWKGIWERSQKEEELEEQADNMNLVDDDSDDERDRM